MGFSHKHFRNTEMDQLEANVNASNSSADDIICAISGNDFHLFSRKGNKEGGKWVHKSSNWSQNQIDHLEAHFDSGSGVMLGLSGNNLHYLLWEAAV